MPFHLALVGDVNQRALVADDIARRIPYRPRGIEKHGCGSVLSLQLDLACAHAAAIVDRPPQHGLAWIEIQCWRLNRQQFALFVIPQHADQRGIRLQQLSLGRAEVDTLLQSLEQFGEAEFFLALLGDVAAQHAHAHDLVTLHDAVQDTIEVKRARTVLQPDPYRPGPALLIEKASQAAFHFFAHGFIDEVVNLVARSARYR